MTVAGHRTPRTTEPPMDTDLFERLAVQAFEADRVRMEMFNGKVWVHTVTDGAHAGILTWLMREFMAHRPDLDLITSGLGLRIDTYRNGAPDPRGSSFRSAISTRRASGPIPMVSSPSPR
jgi:hypothetical protein